MSTPTAICEIVNTSILTPVIGANNYDLVLRTDTTSQKVMLSTGSNIIPGITLSNNNVGIRNNAPVTALDVIGDIQLSGVFRASTSNYTFFSASNSTATAYSGSANVIFNSVGFDYDNSYNASTGVFTAKRNGIYLFQAIGNNFLNTNNRLGFQILMNGTTAIAYGQVPGGTGVGNTLFGIARLNTNDTVNVQAYNYVCVDTTTTFAGYMLLAV